MAESDYGDKKTYSCVHCGPYTLTRTATAILADQKKIHAHSWRYLPHMIRRMKCDLADPYMISSDALKELLQNPITPSPREQADNFILELGKRTSNPGEMIDVTFLKEGAKIGSQSPESFNFALSYLLDEDLLVGETFMGANACVYLSFAGWDRFDELNKGIGTGTTAFMAMQFNNEELDAVVKNCISPSVDATGFTLRRIDDPEHQRAGLIDDRLRVEINAARFMICDLTHNNSGAYWEAGYAEGLGKPVIYTCKKSVFDERAKKGAGTHFDTNHHLHILWDTDNLSDTIDRLKACIRATIPDAKQTD